MYKLVHVNLSLFPFVNVVSCSSYFVHEVPFYNVTMCGVCVVIRLLWGIWRWFSFCEYPTY